jgi:peptide/nickel transport system substrate-binding protein
VPQAICELTPGNINRHLLVDRDTPPFNNPELRRAMALSIDRKAFVDTVTQGKGDIGGILQPPPGGLWGMPPDQINELPGSTRTCKRTARRPVTSWGNSDTGPITG